MSLNTVERSRTRLGMRLRGLTAAAPIARPWALAVRILEGPSLVLLRAATRTQRVWLA